jgi:hypothetical protein
MKQIFITISIILIIPLNLFSQSEFDGTTYRAWVHLKKRYKVPTGILYSIGDSTLTLSKDYYIPSTTQKEFHIHQIEKIQVRKKGKLGKSIALGGAFGGVLGAIIGLSFGDGAQCTRTETRTSTSIPFFFGEPVTTTTTHTITEDCDGLKKGGKSVRGFFITGEIIGSQTIVIPLGKNQEKLNAERERLRSFAILKD